MRALIPECKSLVFAFAGAQQIFHVHHLEQPSYFVAHTVGGELAVQAAHQGAKRDQLPEPAVIDPAHRAEVEHHVRCHEIVQAAGDVLKSLVETCTDMTAKVEDDVAGGWLAQGDHVHLVTHQLSVLNEKKDQ